MTTKPESGRLASEASQPEFRKSTAFQSEWTSISYMGLFTLTGASEGCYMWIHFSAFNICLNMLIFYWSSVDILY